MVKKLFSKDWVNSTQTRKQRKYRYNAPLHIKHKFLSANLSKALQKDHNQRNITLRKGDEVKVMTGQFKGKVAKITRVSISRTKIYLEGVGINKADGSLALYPINPSNLQVVSLNLDDKKRLEKINKVKKINLEKIKVGGKK